MTLCDRHVWHTVDTFLPHQHAWTWFVTHAPPLTPQGWRQDGSVWVGFQINMRSRRLSHVLLTYPDSVSWETCANRTSDPIPTNISSQHWMSFFGLSGKRTHTLWLVYISGDNNNQMKRLQWFAESDFVLFVAVIGIPSYMRLPPGSLLQEQK